MNNHLFYCRCFQVVFFFFFFFLLFYVSRKIDIILADRLQHWTSTYMNAGGAGLGITRSQACTTAGGDTNR